MRWMVMLASLLIVAQVAAEPPAAVVALQEQVRTLIETAEPSIAAIVVSTNPAYPALDGKNKPGTLGNYFSVGPRTDGIVPPTRDPLDLSDPRNAADNTFGSGIVLDSRGTLLTNYHLIEGARKIFVRFSDGQSSYADIHAADARSDLAVLRMLSPFSKPRKPVKFGRVQMHDEPLRKATIYRGQFIVAMAHPFATGFRDGKASASSGMISNLRRRAPNLGSDESRQTLLHHYSNLLQTDTRLSVGSSGGAIFNLDGEVIGLQTAIAAISGSEAGGGYAIPMDPIYRRIVEVLRTGQEVEYGFLGVSPGRMTATGLRLGNVSSNSPASRAGLQDGDLIVSVDGRPITELEDLFLLVGGSLAETEIVLEIQRDKAHHVVKPRLAKFAHTFPSIASEQPEPVFGLRVDHSSLLAQQPMLIGERRTITRGVVVRDIEPGSPAAEKLAPAVAGKSMVIISVNGKSVTTPTEFYELTKGIKRITLQLRGATDRTEARTITLP